MRKFNGHWFITRYVQIFYPLNSSISLGKGFPSLLPTFYKLGFLANFLEQYWKGAQSHYSVSFHSSPVLIYLFILAHFKVLGIP